jgi:hypothetical protein
VNKYTVHSTQSSGRPLARWVATAEGTRRQRPRRMLTCRSAARSTDRSRAGMRATGYRVSARPMRSELTTVYCVLSTGFPPALSHVASYPIVASLRPWEVGQGNYRCLPIPLLRLVVDVTTMPLFLALTGQYGQTIGAGQGSGKRPDSGLFSIKNAPKTGLLPVFPSLGRSVPQSQCGGTSTAPGGKNTGRRSVPAATVPTRAPRLCSLDLGASAGVGIFLGKARMGLLSFARRGGGPIEAQVDAYEAMSHRHISTVPPRKRLLGPQHVPALLWRPFWSVRGAEGLPRIAVRRSVFPVSNLNGQRSQIGPLRRRSAGGFARLFTRSLLTERRLFAPTGFLLET